MLWAERPHLLRSAVMHDPEIEEGLELLDSDVDVDGVNDRDAPAESAASELEAAMQLLANADPAAYHKSISGLLRHGQGALLQPMPYNAALPFHDPTCVVVEPEQTGT